MQVQDDHVNENNKMNFIAFETSAYVSDRSIQIANQLKKLHTIIIVANA